MRTQIPRTTAPPPAALIIRILTLLSSPFLWAFLSPKPSSTAAELDSTVVVEEGCINYQKKMTNIIVYVASLAISLHDFKRS